MSGQFWTNDAMATPLSTQERALRDLFVQEYLKDFDQYGAAIRCGFMASFATEYASRFMEEPYVRQQIALHQLAVSENPKEEELHTRRMLRASLLREAHYHGPGSSHSARVSALAKLASMYDMDAPIRTKNEHLHKGGVMMVPAIADVDAWEQAAADSQEALRKASEVTTDRQE